MHLRHLPHVSELERYKLSRFSSERLLQYITLLTRNVEIFMSRPTPSRHRYCQGD